MDKPKFYYTVDPETGEQIVVEARDEAEAMDMLQGPLGDVVHRTLPTKPGLWDRIKNFLLPPDQY